MSRPLRVIACVVVCATVAGAAPAAGAAGTRAAHTTGLAAITPPAVYAGTSAGASTAIPTSETPIPVPASETPPAGHRLSSDEVLAIAGAVPEMRSTRAKYPGSFGDAYLKYPFRWQVSYFSRDGKKEIGQVIISDLSGRVLEHWTGFQVAWTMARGYPGAFGRHVNALYIWLPLCVLFLLPFVNVRRPFSLVHLDLLVLLSFSASLAFFNHAHIYASVPLTYPPMLYLLARMLALSARTRARPADPLHLLVPMSWLAFGAVFLIGFRIALNVTDSNVIDVGFAGVIGAERITHDESLYGGYPSNNEHGDTYGPVNYEAYVPFEQVFGWSGRWDDLPAAHAASIAFDLLAMALLFLLGRRVRGPSLGIVLVYAWAAYPFTLYALESNSNDTLVAVLVLAALLAASYRSKLAPGARGAFAALAGLTKFAPLALAPLLATNDLTIRRADAARALESGEVPPQQSPHDRAGAFSVAVFAAGFLLMGALASIPALSHDSLHTIYERSISYQADRGSPFSVWGLYGGLAGWQSAAQVLAVLLALALAVVPRRADLVGLAAACAAVIIALQMTIDHWFYLYIPWFFPLVLLALLGRFSAPRGRPAAASGSALSNLPAVVLSSESTPPSATDPLRRFRSAPASA